MPAWMLTPAPLEPGRVAKHHLVAQTRLWIHAVTMLDVNPLDPAGVAAVEGLSAALEEVTGRLQELPVLPGGPTEAGGDDARLLERSGITGRSNPLSAPLHIWLEDDRVLGWAEYPQQYEGPPGCVHGGFVAAAFDDLLGAAQTLSGQAGFTGTLTIRMERPTPLNQRIDYEGGLSGVEGRKIAVWGTARCGGEVIARAEGIFVQPRAGMEDERMRRARAAVLGRQTGPGGSSG
jgi:acyl-coenzyme A thioesterase PaaI-like protein